MSTGVAYINLQPDQPEIPLRSAHVAVAPVQHQHLMPARRKPEGHAQPYDAPANDCCACLR